MARENGCFAALLLHQLGQEWLTAGPGPNWIVPWVCNPMHTSLGVSPIRHNGIVYCRHGKVDMPKMALWGTYAIWVYWLGGSANSEMASPCHCVRGIVKGGETAGWVLFSPLLKGKYTYFKPYFAACLPLLFSVGPHDVQKWVMSYLRLSGGHIPDCAHFLLQDMAVMNFHPPVLFLHVSAAAFSLFHFKCHFIMLAVSIFMMNPVFQGIIIITHPKVHWTGI